MKASLSVSMLGTGLVNLVHGWECCGISCVVPHKAVVFKSGLTILQYYFHLSWRQAVW